MRALLALLFAAAAASAQSYTQRGFIENRGTFYPQKAPHDRARAVGESLFRYEGFYTASPKLQMAGAVDFRVDTHHQVERDFKLSWQDREVKRPLGEVRRLSATYHNGPLTFEVGKQFIRWGKTDIVTPTDRFAPRDFLTVVDNDFIAITAARLNFEKGSNTIEAVWSPRFTPSRVPLPDQRWAPPVRPDFPVSPVKTDFPGGFQSGIRWNHNGAIESEFSLYQGFNHLPSFKLTFPGAPLFQTPGDPPALSLGPRTNPTIQAFYPKMLMAGGDVAVPLPQVTVKAEAAYFNSRGDQADDCVMYVVQLERQAGEWFFVGGYAGEAVTKTGSHVFVFNNEPGFIGGFSQIADFAPDRGLTKTLLGRAGYTIDANRSVAFEAAARQNGEGLWVKSEYSQAFGQHWRATLNLTLIRGDVDDFLGQYRRNSHALFIVRYSF